MQAYFKVNKLQINPKVPDRISKVLEHQARRSLKITQSLGIPRQIKVEHNVFWSLIGRRTGWVAETVKVYDVCNASGSIKKSVHEGLEGVPLCVSNLELCQLVLFDVFEVHSDQGQRDISATASR